MILLLQWISYNDLKGKDVQVMNYVLFENFHSMISTTAENFQNLLLRRIHESGNYLTFNACLGRDNDIDLMYININLFSFLNY